MIKEVLAHEAVVALQRPPIHRPVFVEVERHDGPERHSLFAVETDQLVIHADRRTPGGEAEDGLPTGRRARPHQIGDLPGHRPTRVARLLVNRHRQALDRAAVLMGRLGQRPAVNRQQGVGSRAATSLPPLDCRLRRHGGSSVDPRGPRPPRKVRSAEIPQDCRLRVVVESVRSDQLRLPGHGDRLRRKGRAEIPRRRREIFLRFPHLIPGDILAGVGAHPGHDRHRGAVGHPHADRIAGRDAQAVQPDAGPADEVGELLPLGLRGRGARVLVRRLQLVERDRELELVLRVGGSAR